MEEIFFWGSEAPDTFIDIGDVIDLIIKSLLAHTSQVQDWVEEAGGEEAFGERMKAMSANEVLTELSPGLLVLPLP